MKLNLFILSVIMFFLIGCSKNENVNNSILNISVSIFPIYDIVKNIAGEKANVNFIIPPGANPHNYSIKPSTVIQLSHSNLLIGVSKDFDGWIGKYTPANSKKIFLENDTKNPHIWLSVKNGKKIAKKIEKILSENDKSNEKFYKDNLKKYLKKLNNVDLEIFKIFEKIKNKKFIQWHEAWNYFASDYNLKIIGTIEHGHGEKPSLKFFSDLIKKAKKESVSVVVIGIRVKSSAVKNLIKEIDGKKVALDSIGTLDFEDRSTYINLLRYNAQKLSTGLREINN